MAFKSIVNKLKHPAKIIFKLLVNNLSFVILRAGMRNRISPLFIVVCSAFLLLFTSVAAIASSPAVHLSPRPAWINAIKVFDKKVPLRQVENGYFYQLFEEQVQIEKQADYRHFIREIVSAAGIQNGSEINISFDPSYERLDIHDITVWRDGKPSSRLNLKSFKVIADEKELSRFIYQGSFSAFCILNDIRKGDRIEYSFTITGRNPIFGTKFTDDIYFQGGQAYAQMYKALFASPDRKLNFKLFNKAPVAALSDKNGLKCYEWNLTQVAIPIYPDNAPSWFDNYNHIQVSDYNNWQEVVDWAQKVNPIATNLSGELAARVAKMKADARGDKEKYFRSAVQMVQDEIRYMGIELGEYSHRANAPEKVYNQRYGDCKDKALLLASVLMANGIEAHMVLINTHAEDKVSDYLPSPTVFDHAVCVATINNKPVYIDATISYQRGSGTNLYFPNYGKGLVLKAGNKDLTAISPSKTGKTLITENYKIIDAEKGNTQLDVISTYTLNEADRMRDKLASNSMSETEKGYLEYYAKTYPKIESAADSLTVKDDVKQNVLTTIEHYKVPDFFKPGKEAGKYNASVYASYINERLPGVGTRAKFPVAIAFPYNIQCITHVVLNSGWNTEHSSNTIKRDAYAFASDVAASGDTLTLDYTFSTSKNFIAINKLDETRDDVKQISDNELGFDFAYTPDISKAPFHLNYWMAAFLVVLVAGLALFGIKLYRTKTPKVVFEPGAGFIPVGGWLILIAIGLALTPVVVGDAIVSGAYLKASKWHIHFNGVNDIGLKALLIFEVAGNVFMICYALFCLVLLINKRDILPKYIIGFYAFAALFAVGDYVFALSVSGSVADITVFNMVRRCIFSGIWIAYFKSSERVEQTFIVPFPHSNYSY